MRTVLEIIWEGIEPHKATALMIGGQALPAFGVAMQTVDVDCLVTDSDSKILDAVLTEAGYTETERTENFVRYSHSSVYLMDVDLMLVDNDTFEKMLEHSFIYRVETTNIHITWILAF